MSVLVPLNHWGIEPTQALIIPQTPQERGMSELHALEERLQKDQLRREMISNFGTFIRNAWPTIDTAKLHWGTPLGDPVALACDVSDLHTFYDIIAYECMRWINGEIRHLAIAVPPGSAKSMIASVLLPLWAWLSNPIIQFLCCAHGQALSTRDCVKSRDMIRSAWFRETFLMPDGGVPKWDLKKDQDEKTRYQLEYPPTAMGRGMPLGLRQGIGGKSGLTGWRGDKSIVDDPIDLNPMKPPRIEDYEAGWSWQQYIRTQRCNDAKVAQQLLIMQCSHELDAIQRTLKNQEFKNDDGAWTFLMMDQRAAKTLPVRHIRDRREPGALLMPERWGEPEVKDFEESMTPAFFAATQQQCPTPEGGNIIKEPWLRYIDAAMGREEDPYGNLGYDFVIQSWDCALKDKEENCPVVGITAGIKNRHDLKHRRFDILEVVRKRMDVIETRESIKAMAYRWPQANYIIVEDKANGPAVIADLKSILPIIRPFNPNPYGSKSQRLSSVAVEFFKGCVRLLRADWLAVFEAELTRFPAYPTDDQCDAVAQLIISVLHHLDEWIKEDQDNDSYCMGGWGENGYL